MRFWPAGRLLVLAAALTLATAASAQTFYLDCPGDRSASVPVGQAHEFPTPIWTPPGSDGSVDVHFEVFLPDGWFAQWCQESTGICYFGDETVLLPAQQIDRIRVDFFPDPNVPGMGWANLEIRATNDPSEVQRCSYALFSGQPLPSVNVAVDCSAGIAYPPSGTQLQEFFSPMINRAAQPDSLYCRFYSSPGNPPSWFAQFCQTSNGVCYFEEGVLGLAPGVPDSIKVDVFTMGVSGGGVYDLEMHSTRNPSVFQWCRYQVYQGGAPAGVDPIVAAARVTSWAAPNPFTDAAMLALRTDREGVARLRIFNADGRLVRDFAETRVAAGLHQVSWDGRSDAGSRVPSGVYYYRWTTEAAEARGTLILAR